MALHPSCLHHLCSKQLPARAIPTSLGLERSDLIGIQEHLTVSGLKRASAEREYPFRITALLEERMTTPGNVSKDLATDTD